MDAIVQLIRNGLCCVKDLQLLYATPLYDPKLTAEFYVFPTPYMSKTTPLEVLIALAQLYACVSCTISGVKMILNSGIFKLKRLARVSDLLGERKKDEDAKEKKDGDEKEEAITSTANKLAVASIMNEANAALRNVLVGICVLAIGIAFFWYFGNSLHITEAGWIGGVPALVHATIVMEVALIPLLYYMIKDAAAAFQNATKVRNMLDQYADKKCKDVAKDVQQFVTLDTYSLIVKQDGWTPFWTEGAKSGIDVNAEKKMLTKEMEALETSIKSFSSSDGAIVTDEKASSMEQAAKTSVLEGYREYFYLFVNTIAFYGYMLGVVAFYFDDEENQPAAVSYLKLGYSNADADWGGNFAGDFMWTIEPIVILASPFLIKQMTKPSSTKKEKSD